MSDKLYTVWIEIKIEGMGETANIQRSARFEDSEYSIDIVNSLLDVADSDVKRTTLAAQMDDLRDFVYPSAE